MSAPKSEASRGFVLIEVLLAVGLLGLVTSCLLAAFQHARKIEGELRATLDEVDSRNRLVESLDRDLMCARTILVDDPSTNVSPSLSLLLEPDPSSGTIEHAVMVQYTWLAKGQALGRSDPGGWPTAGRFSGATYDPSVPGILRRTERGSDGLSISEDLGEFPAPEFELVAESPTKDGGVGFLPRSISTDPAGLPRPHGNGLQAKLVRLRFQRVSGSAGGVPSEGFSVHFAVPLPISSVGEIGP